MKNIEHGFKTLFLETLPEGVIPNFLPDLAGSSGHVFQEGVSGQIRYAQEYLPYPGPECRILRMKRMRDLR